MAFFNFRKRYNERKGLSSLQCTSDSLVNPLYKPKTLGELKALMVHTGINPAPVALRSPLPENVDGIDAMDAPPVRTSGDIFENMRESARLVDEMKQAEYDLRNSAPKPKVPDVSPEGTDK